MPTETKRRGVLRWRGVVKLDGKIVASKWFGAGPKERRQAILWEEAEKERIKRERQTTPTVLLTPLGWANEYLNDVQRRCSQKTYIEKKTAMIRLLKFAGDRPLQQFTPSFARDYLNSQYDSRSGYAANKDRKNLSTAWEYGRKLVEGFPSLPNPFLAVDRFKEERRPRYVPPEEDFNKVLAVAKGQDLVMLKTFEHLAARRGEVFGLKWTDVDWRADVVWLTTMKTRDHSRRRDAVPMSEELRSILMKWWQDRPYKQSEYVFTVLDDSPSPNHNAGDAFRYRQHFMGRVCEKAGVKPFDFHSIRHLSAVRLYKAGHPVSLIQKILRHQNAATTERYLASLGFEYGEMREAVEIFSRGPAKVISLPQKEKAL